MPGGTKRPDIVFLSAVILVSPDPTRLARFYSDLLDVPLRESRHDGGSDAHYECEVADLHFAIHELSHLPWAKASGSRVSIALSVPSLGEVITRLQAAGVPLLYEPEVVGFATMTAVLDPDGNIVQLTELSDSWLTYLRSRRSTPLDPLI